jgi:hypothetical protein
VKLERLVELAQLEELVLPVLQELLAELVLLVILALPDRLVLLVQLV